MSSCYRTLVILLMFSATYCLAQEPGWEWEIGGAGGYAIAKKNHVENDVGGSGEAGIHRGFIASAVAGNHMFRYLSGEVRYIYRKGNLRVTSGGTKVSMTGESHSVNYDLLLHTAPKEAKVRPYVAFGGGAKVFRGVGAETDFQPLEDLAVLTKTQQTEPMLSIGGGVSVRLAPYAVLRLDFRDQVTPFPKKVILPVPGAKLDGFLHDFLPMVGIGLTF